MQAYAAGCDIVILASDFQRVQIIPGATHGNIQVRCVDCSSDTGKVGNLWVLVKPDFIVIIQRTLLTFRLPLATISRSLCLSLRLCFIIQALMYAHNIRASLVFIELLHTFVMVTTFFSETRLPMVPDCLPAM